MSGYIIITVTEGDTTALRAAVTDGLCDMNDDPENDPAAIFLSEVDRLNTTALIAADPTASWHAACDHDTDTPNRLHMYADGQLLTAGQS